MVIDEVSVYSQLASASYGALAHTVSVLGTAFETKVAAGRLIDTAAPLPRACVMLSQLSLPTGAATAMQDWPLQPDSVFGYFQKNRWNDFASRPSSKIDELTYSQLRLYQPVDAFTNIVDSLCLCVPLETAGWAMICLLRCGEQKSFTDPLISTLDRFKPSIANTIDRAIATLGPVEIGSEACEEISQPTDSPETLIAKLTPTERTVLHFLQAGITEREIGNQMHRSPHTIHVHVKNIYRKLDVSSRSQLMDKLEQDDQVHE